MHRTSVLAALAGLAAALPASAQLSGPATSQGSYMIPSDPASGVSFWAWASNGNGTQTPDELYMGLRSGAKDYRLIGIPDGLGAFRSADDIARGTFTLTSNHELVAGAGIARAHGNAGAFVSYWTVDSRTFDVVGGKDLSAAFYLWNTSTKKYDVYDTAHPMSADCARFCSADVAAPSAYRFGDLGTDARIHMNGEENGVEGRAFAHMISGDEAGTSWELPWLGKMSWENSVACPFPQAETIILCCDDSTPGNVSLYVGTKQSSGLDIDKAGLTNGRLYLIGMDGTTVEGSQRTESRTYVLGSEATGRSESKRFFTIDMGDVSSETGATVQADGDSKGQMNFLRPEDAAWDTKNPNRAYFVTTDSFTGNSRLWAIDFDSIQNPESGGTITMLIDGSDPASLSGGIVSATGLTDIRMMDNMGVGPDGQIVITEDVGNNPRLGRLWLYDPAADRATEVGISDPKLFDSAGTAFLTQDEETSGIISAADVIGPGWWLLDMQAHYAISGELVEGGQEMAAFIPATAGCRPDCNGDGNLNVNDFICFQAKWRTHDRYADFKGDGKWDISDFLAFQVAFRTGCK